MHVLQSKLLSLIAIILLLHIATYRGANTEGIETTSQYHQYGHTIATYVPS